MIRKDTMDTNCSVYLSRPRSGLGGGRLAGMRQSECFYVAEKKEIFVTLRTVPVYYNKEGIPIMQTCLGCADGHPMY